jgi:iron complex outermembrane receptor protein
MKLRVKILPAAVAGTLAASMYGPAFAQAPAAAAKADDKVDRIEVTGSLIKRVEGEAALPVTVISIDELLKAGVTNAEQAVKLIAQQQGGTVTSASVSGTNGAASYANLRALGAQRTLVLLNGKRIVSNPFSSVAVDLNTLPLAAVQRIEVLSDGASATYGTDAIAGVINFITHKDFRGGTISAEAQVPKDKGGEQYKADILAGMGNMAKQGWNVNVAFSYRENKPMFGTDRDFSRSAFIPEYGLNALSPTTFPANYTQGSLVTNPSIPTCAPPTSIYTPQGNGVGLGTTRCGADTQAFTWTIPDQKQWNGSIRGTLALDANHTASFDYFKANNKVRTRIAPSPEGGLTMGPDSPFYPGNGITPITDPALNRTATISIGWRTTVLGARSGEQENNTERAVASLEGSGFGWDYQAAGLWSKAKVENYFLNGYPTTTAMLNGVRGTNGAPFLNPFGPQTAAGLAFLQANQVLGLVQSGEGKLSSISASASRPLFNLAGGATQLALATEFRKEEMLYLTDVPKVSQAASSGLAGSGARRAGDRDVKALAAELNLPILKNLELAISARYDKYSDFGSTTNPKAAIRFTPHKDLLLRTSYNEGFTAPTLTQLYAPTSTTFTGGAYNDPLLCPNGVVNPAAGGIASRDCRIQFQQQQGGNTQLTPENSKAWTVGFVYQITPKLSVGLDQWFYRVKNNISVLGENTIFGDPVTYANLYVRCSRAPAALQASIGACRVPGGDPLAYIINTNQNLGDTFTRGVDLQANWASGATPYGAFTASLRGTYVTDYQFQVVKNGAYFYPVGNYNANFGGPVIRYQQVTNFGWQKGNWSTNLLNRFQSGYRDQNGGSVAPSFRTNTVKSYSIFDLAVTYTGFKGLTLQGGLLNLANTDPPFTNQTARFQARAYDDRVHNPLGRVYTFSAKYNF